MKPILLIALLGIAPLAAQNDAMEAQAKLWNELKSRLLVPGGLSYFESNLKDAVTPDGVYGVYFYRGTVRSTEPKNAPDRIWVSLSASKEPEVLVLLSGKLCKAAWKTPLPPGSLVDFFVGIPVAFRSEPFLVTMEVPIDRFAVRKLAK